MELGRPWAVRTQGRFTLGRCLLQHSARTPSASRSVRSHATTLRNTPQRHEPRGVLRAAVAECCHSGLAAGSFNCRHWFVPAHNNDNVEVWQRRLNNCSRMAVASPYTPVAATALQKKSNSCRCWRGRCCKASRPINDLGPVYTDWGASTHKVSKGKRQR